MKEELEFLKAIAESNSSFLSGLQFYKCIHNSTYAQLKSMNQFFYNVATTYWALEHVLFVINYKVHTMYSEEEQR